MVYFPGMQALEFDSLALRDWVGVLDHSVFLGPFPYP